MPKKKKPDDDAAAEEHPAGLTRGVDPVVTRFAVISRPAPDPGITEPKPKPDVRMDLKIVHPKIPLEIPKKEAKPDVHFDLRVWKGPRRAAPPPPSVGSLQPPGGKKR